MNDDNNVAKRKRKGLNRESQWPEERGKHFEGERWMNEWAKEERGEGGKGIAIV